MPTRDTPWPQGTPCWVDYGAEDLDGARALYSELFGWTYTGGEEEYGGYLTCQLDGRDAAGMAPRMDPAQPVAWSTWFAADDADAMAARVREAGGTVVVEPMDVGPMGRMAFALDPQGNAFGLWQAGVVTGVRAYNEPGALVWTDGAVEDLDAARAFYTRVLGVTWSDVEGMDSSAYQTFALDSGGDPLGGLGRLDEGTPRGWTTCFATASTDDAVAVVERHGGKVVMPPEDTPYGRLAVVEDPWGAAFSLMQLPSSPTP